MIPPTHMIGAAIMKVNVMKASICTCWTSLVDRVISVGAPNCATSRAANVSTLPKTAPRRSRPNAIAVRAPKYTATIEQAIWTRVTPSMTAPILMMYPCRRSRHRCR